MSDERDEVLDEGEDGQDGQGDAPDLYTMSDEELARLDPSTLAGSGNASNDDDQGSSDDDADESDEIDESDDNTGNDESPASEASPGGSPTGDTGERTKSGTGNDDSDASDASEDESDAASDNEQADPEKDAGKGKNDDTAPDAATELSRLLAPFRANGHQMQVRSVDEAITLMQQGANYTRKMQALKPHLKTVKALENNGITSEADLAFLIDLKRGEKAAIAKLIKDAGVDPMDLDDRSSETYQPGAHGVSDKEIALDQALRDIEGSETYARTIQVIGREWDESSKNTIGDNPELIAVINDHIASGVYDVIATELARQRSLGQLQGLSDLDAYKEVGAGIQATGGFDHLPPSGRTGQGGQNAAPTARSGEGQPSPPTPKRLPPKGTPDNEKLNQRRRAAGPARTSPATPRTDFNPLGMSDEEFERHFGARMSQG